MPNINFWILPYFGRVLLANRVHNRVRVLRIHTHTHTHFQTQYPYPPHTHFFPKFRTHTHYKWGGFKAGFSGSGATPIPSNVLLKYS